MERFQGKILEAMSLLSRLWKGVENIRKAPYHEAVELWVDKLVTLVEQVILLLGQDSLSYNLTLCFIITPISGIIDHLCIKENLKRIRKKLEQRKNNIP